MSYLAFLFSPLILIHELACLHKASVFISKHTKLLNSKSILPSITCLSFMTSMKHKQSNYFLCPALHLIIFKSFILFLSVLTDAIISASEHLILVLVSSISLCIWRICFSQTDIETIKK